MRHSRQRTNPRPPSTPPNPSTPSALGLSLPASPSTATTVSEEDNMESSYLLVSEEDETSSNVGSSLRDSVIGDISDSGSEAAPIGREHWEEGDIADALQREDPADDIIEIDNTTLEESLVGGSYIDAEATASDMTGSRSTIHDHLQHLSDSQVRLIMPDPGASFTTSSGTISADTTPSGSFGNLLKVADPPTKRLTVDRRDTNNSVKSIDKSWLEASSKLWNVPPQFGSEGSSGSDGSPSPRYQLLSSQTEVEKVDFNDRDTLEDIDKQGILLESLFSRPEKMVLPTTRPQTRSLKRAIMSARLEGLGSLAGNWSVRASALALALLLCLSSLGYIDPLVGRSIPQSSIISDTTSTVNEPLQTAGKTFWSNLLPVPASPSLTNTVSSDEPSPSAKIPDLLLIKQALSTFSTVSSQVSNPGLASSTTLKNNKASPAPAEGQAKSPEKKQFRSDSRDPCCALMVRDGIVALTIQNTTKALSTVPKSWGKAMANKLPFVKANTSGSTSQAEAVRVIPNCSCDMIDLPLFPSLPQYLAMLHPISNYSSQAIHYMSSIYGPALAELQKEFGELMVLLKTIAETTSTLSQFVIRRASRGVNISRRGLEQATKKLRANMPEIPQPEFNPEAMARARETLDQLSEYVEDQAVNFADYLEEQTAIMQERSMDSLRQAKKGLDKIVREAKKMIGDEGNLVKSTNVNKNGPMPFGQMKEVRRGSRQSKRKTRQRGQPRSKMPSPEKSSKARKLLDLIHHGAMALVI